MMDIINLLLNTQPIQENSPQYQYYIRQKAGIFGAKQIGENEEFITELNKFMIITNDGSLIAADSDSILIKNQIQNIKQITQLYLSPDQEYLFVTTKQECIVYSLKTIQVMKIFPKPYYHFFFDSTYSLCFTQNEVYQTCDFKLVKTFQYPKDEADLSISVQRDNLQISFVTLTKPFTDIPTKLIVYPYNSNYTEYELPLANEVKQLWSENGQTLLIWGSRLEDSKNQSYFGEHYLYIYGKQELKPVNVFEGPIYDVAWMKNQFIVLSGFMPAGAVLYNQNGVQQYLIFQSHINQLYISPNQEYFILAGLGNLSGDIYIFNKDLQKIGQTRKDKVTQFQWTSDSKYFILATTFPKLRVSNCFQINNILGENVYQKKFDEMYEIQIQHGFELSFNIQQNNENKQIIKKDIDLQQGVDFVKLIKDSQLSQSQPRKLLPDEQLGEKKAIETAPQQKQQQAKPVILMRRQQLDEQVQERQEIEENIKKKKKNSQKGKQKQDNNNINNNNNFQEQNIINDQDKKKKEQNEAIDQTDQLVNNCVDCLFGE